MSCTLDKFTTYSVGRVVRDESEGRLTVQLIDPPPACPDKSYSSKKAELVVQPGVGPILSYDAAKNRAVVIVPNEAMVQVIPKEGMGTFGIILIVSALAAAVAAFLYFLSRGEKKPKREKHWSEAVRRSPNYGVRHGFERFSNDGRHERKLGSSLGSSIGSSMSPKFQSPPKRATTNIYDSPTHRSSDDGPGFMTGLAVGMLLDSDSGQAQARREESASPSYSSDSSSSYSSDDSSRSSSYSSDSSSSYSSDSSSSSSYDSGSSFSSDSGGSFSSD